jgi:L-idonate 5-dehydrogenase
MVDLKLPVSATLSYRDTGRAVALAADRTQSMKGAAHFDG